MAAMIGRGVSTLLSRALPSSSRLQWALCRSAVAALEPAPAPAPWAVQSRPKTTWWSRPKKNTWPPPRPRRKMMWEIEDEIEKRFVEQRLNYKPHTILNSRVFHAGYDYKHWCVGMFFSKRPRPPSEDEVIATFIKTIATVVGSEEEAEKRIYRVVIPETYRGGVCRFGVLISAKQANEVRLLPGVRHADPDFYIDLVNQDYGGDLLVDRKVIRRGEIKHEFYESGFLKAWSKGRFFILPGQEQPASQQMSENPQQAQENGPSQQMSENPQQAQENGPKCGRNLGMLERLFAIPCGAHSR